jgi:2-hydroxy-3-keto-5-methylthiopentenyl-1-phosphate phosphatase
LQALGVQLEIHANPGRVEPGRGLIMERPVGSPYASLSHGIDKAAIVRAGLERGQRVAFAGDGFPDLAAARLVSASHRFARHDLRSALERERLGFTPFERWGEVAAHLCGPLRIRGS